MSQGSDKTDVHQSQYFALFADAIDAILLMDAEGRIQSANGAAERLFGYPTAELLGKRFLMLTPSRFREGFGQSLQNYQATGRGAYVGATREVIGLHKDGSEFPLEISVAAGEAEGKRWMAAFARDVGERHRAAEALRRSEESLRQVLEASPDAIGVIRDAQVVYTNAAARAVMGTAVTPESPLDLRDVLPPGEMLVIEQRLAEAAEKQAALPVREMQFRRNDGEVRTVEVVSAPIVYEGRPAFVSVGRDVTERRRMQAEMQRADRLAAIGVMAASVAHEINNPLAYITLNIETVRRRLEELRQTGNMAPVIEGATTLLQQTAEGVERVRRICRDLQAFGRPGGEDRQPVDIRQCLDRAVDMTQNDLRHRARLVRDYGPAPLVLAEEGRLVQVFLNLLVNARDALPDSRPAEHEVRLTLRTGDNGEAVVEVRDTGAGMPAEQLARIFEPFHTTKAASQGTGLGLFVSQNIVTGLGGAIAAESTVGAGSVFRVSLPACSQSAPAPRPEGTPQSSPYSTARVVGSRRARLLVVDDEELIGQAIQDFLPGYEVKVVTSARRALGLLSEDEDFDVLLCDIHMPEMSGIELMDQLRSRYPNLADRTVFLSGGAFTEKSRQFLANVQNPVLEKPFAPRALETLVAQTMANRR